MDMIQKAVHQMGQRQQAQSAARQGAGTTTAPESSAAAPQGPGLRSGRPLIAPIDPRQVDANSAPGKQFRVLARRLLDRWAEAPRPEGRVVMLTSAEAGEGCSFVALNLARALAASPELSVVLVDAAPDPSGLTHGMRLAQAQGWSEVSAGAAALDHALLSTDTPHLWFMPAGRATPTGADAVSDLASAMDQLKRRFRVVVCDTSPLLEAGSAVPMAEQADSVLIVASAGRTDPVRLRAAVAMVQTPGTVECVLNRGIQALTVLDAAPSVR